MHVLQFAIGTTSSPHSAYAYVGYDIPGTGVLSMYEYTCMLACSLKWMFGSDRTMLRRILRSYLVQFAQVPATTTFYVFCPSAGLEGAWWHHRIQTACRGGSYLRKVKTPVSLLKFVLQFSISQRLVCDDSSCRAVTFLPWRVKEITLYWLSLPHYYWLDLFILLFWRLSLALLVNNGYAFGSSSPPRTTSIHVSCIAKNSDDDYSWLFRRIRFEATRMGWQQQQLQILSRLRPSFVEEHFGAFTRQSLTMDSWQRIGQRPQVESRRYLRLAIPWSKGEWKNLVSAVRLYQLVIVTSQDKAMTGERFFILTFFDFLKWKDKLRWR